MKIGDIDLGEKPVLLAPMEDVTDASFRIVCKRFGADMVYTEFVPSDGLIRDAAKAIAKMKTSDDEAPIGIQIYGNNPEAMVEAAKMADNADQIAGGHGCDVIDINFGCPVSKIAGRGAGSGMMREPDKMVMITKSIVEAVRKPVTVKTRLGWDEDSKIIVELAERLQDTGIKALTVHGRTRCQMYKGEADWTLIGKIKETYGDLWSYLQRHKFGAKGQGRIRQIRRRRHNGGTRVVRPSVDLLRNQALPPDRRGGCANECQ